MVFCLCIVLIGGGAMKSAVPLLGTAFTVAPLMIFIGGGATNSAVPLIGTAFTVAPCLVFMRAGATYSAMPLIGMAFADAAFVPMGAMISAAVATKSAMPLLVLELLLLQRVPQGEAVVLQAAFGLGLSMAATVALFSALMGAMSESDVLRRDPLPESSHGRGNATRESVGLDPGLASSFAIAGARAPQGGEGDRSTPKAKDLARGLGANGFEGPSSRTLPRGST